MTNEEKNQAIIAARFAAFKAKMDSGNGKWNRDDILANLSFLLYIGAGDNIAKNFYPYTFGGLYMLRNDDLDTILPADNQGLDRKPYWVEWFDRYDDGQYMVNAAEGAFIALWWRAYFNSTTDRGFVIMRQMLSALEGLGGVTAGSHLDRLLGWYDKYYTSVKKAFPALLVNEDMMRYERARVAQISGTKGSYTEVNPLRQEQGDHLITDRGWMRKRIVYIMSMASFGDFAHDASSGTITFRLNGTANFRLTPSIKMYPTVTGGQTTIRGARTEAGQVCQLSLSGTDLDSMVNGADWLLDIGEWYNVPIRNNLTVNAKMLKNLYLGTNDPMKVSNMAITISGLTIGNCPSLRTVDVQNIQTLAGALNLRACRLLQEVHADGTSLTSITVPDGAPITKLEYPVTNQNIVLRQLALLDNNGVNYENCAQNVTMFLVSGCTNLNALGMLNYIISAQRGQGENHNLTRVYVDSFDETYDDLTIIDNLTALLQGYQAISKEGMDIGGLPILSGSITMTCPVYEDSVIALQEAFGPGGLKIYYNDVFVRFEDSRVHEICAYNWGYTYDLQEVNGEGGILGAGTLEGNGDADVATDYHFACSTAIGAHGGVSAVAARTVAYRVELEVIGTPTAEGAPWTADASTADTNIRFLVRQYSSAMAAVDLARINMADWDDATYWESQTVLVPDGNGKYHCNVTTTTAAQYLRVFIRAAAGTIVNWKIVSVGVTKMPSGITKDQCAAVTSLQSKFKSNTLIETFNELEKFTKITQFASYEFKNSTLSWINTVNIKTAIGFAFSGCGIKTVYYPNIVKANGYFSVYNTGHMAQYNRLTVLGASLTTIEQYTFRQSGEQTFFVYAKIPPVSNNNALNTYSTANEKIYVPDDSYEAYIADSTWAPMAGYIKRMSEYTGEKPWEELYPEELGIV